MSSFGDFVVPVARPLPVIVLADVSGSMSELGKIEALNAALAEMIASFAQQEEGTAEVHVSVITFGRHIQTHVPLQPAKHVAWSPLEADGMTPLGGALRMATSLLDDPTQIPSRAYRPTVVLVSDGQPNDDWQDAFKRFVSEGRTAKVERLALGIGPDADLNMLNRFGSHPEHPAFKAADARQIRKFFRFVSQTVTSRTLSQDPNAVPITSGAFEAYYDDDDY